MESEVSVHLPPSGVLVLTHGPVDRYADYSVAERERMPCHKWIPQVREMTYRILDRHPFPGRTDDYPRISCRYDASETFEAYGIEIVV